MEALTAVMRDLPGDLDAAVLVVLHVAPIGPSVLPAILNRSSKLPAVHPADGDVLESGHAYVAPPDHHLLVADGLIRLNRGPRENGNRPAADPLFRSLASVYGPRAAAVVLSGALDDGTAGLAAVKQAGGLTVVQDPKEAAFPSMPMSAIAYADPDHVAPLRDIPCLLAAFVKEAAAMPQDPAPGESDPPERLDEHLLTEFTCPECGGTLWMLQDQPLQFRCRVGHTFSPERLAVGKQDAVEDALWAAIVALQERADLARRMLRRIGPTRASASLRYREELEQSERGAATLRRLAELLIGPVAHVAEPAGEADKTVDADERQVKDGEGGA